MFKISKLKVKIVEMVFKISKLKVKNSGYGVKNI